MGGESNKPQLNELLTSEVRNMNVFFPPPFGTRRLHGDHLAFHFTKEFSNNAEPKNMDIKKYLKKIVL